MDAHFGDRRLDARADQIINRVVDTGTLVLRKVGDDRAGEIGLHRFLGNDNVGWSGIIDYHAKKTIENCRGRRIVAAQDTTEINFSGRERRRTGLGAAGDGKSLGFFIHPIVAIDADDEAVVGIVGAEIWTRDGAEKPDRRTRSLEEKESLRWLAGAQRAASALEEAQQVIVVGDRESDIYEVFSRRPGRIDLVVRVAQNRVVDGGGLLFDQILTSYGEISVPVPPKPGVPKRTARVSVRASRVTLTRPRNGKNAEDAKHIEINIVEAVEIEPPAGVTKLHWRLYTTLPVSSLADVLDVIKIYRLRWRIEEVFRVLKADGLKLDDTQVCGRDRLFKLSAISIGAAARIIQLTDARDGSPRAATDVIEADMIEAVAAIGKKLEGKTARQKNSHPVGNLAWLSWIVARLGGWNCYYKPPGPKTMAAGWERLAAMIEGFKIAAAVNVNRTGDVRIP